MSERLHKRKIIHKMTKTK
uniref:Uncharacterized protein n=1 Tax=Anguilla anguilla TaxID=7936 RepID=A0A0E9TGX0_ANGAN